jgi:hypothetical protein
MKRRIALALSGTVLLATAWLVLPHTSSAGEPGQHSGPASVSPYTPPLALIATRDGHSELYLARPGDKLGSPKASFDHLPEGNVRARVLPGGSVLAAAPITPGRDVSFNGGLLRLEPASGSVLPLCSGLTHASRPLVAPSGRVFVERGSAGPPSLDGSLRVDDLRIDEVDPLSGGLRAIHSMSGFVLHLAGWHDGEVLLYRVASSRSDIVAVDPDSRSVRVVLPTLPPFARDFSVDQQAGRLVYRGRHEHDTRRWVVDSVDLRSGHRRRIYEGRSFSLAPHAWPGGGVAINPARAGLELIGASDAVHRPFGPGVDMLRDVSSSGRFVALLHSFPPNKHRGRQAHPFVIDRKSDRSAAIEVVPGARHAIAGFVEGTP